MIKLNYEKYIELDNLTLEDCYNLNDFGYYIVLECGKVKGIFLGE